MQSSQLIERVRQQQSQVSEWKGAAKGIEVQISMLESEADSLGGVLALHKQADAGFHDLESEWRGRFEEKLASLVGQGLSSVFGDDRKVILTHTIKRGVAHLDLETETNGLRTRILGAKGGSVIQILAALFRVLFTVSQKPALLPFMALDEPFSMVSVKFRPALGALIKELGGRLGLQFVIVTHEEELAEAADTVYFMQDGSAQLIKSPTEERQ